MAGYSRSTYYSTFLHHCYYPIDIDIKNKENHPCSSTFLMNGYDDLSLSEENVNTIPVITRHHYENNNKKKRKKQKLQSPKKRKITSIDNQHHQQSGGGSDTNYLQRWTQLQYTLDELQEKWTTINVVLRSLQKVTTIYPSKMTNEDYLDSIHHELSIAHDDLIAQIRSLDRNVEKLNIQIKSLTSA